jgi:hypothetical protein
MGESTRKRYLDRWQALKNERSGWEAHWRDLSDQVNPRRARFLTTNRNKSVRNDKIINSTPRYAARVLASGMMAGVTSPAREWFRLTTPDPDMAEFGPVREWLHVVEVRLRDGFRRSNLYNCLHNLYADLPVVGVAPLHVDEDARSLFRGYVYPVGSYALANSARLQVDTVYRETSLTVGQLVERFGLGACSRSVRERFQRGAIDEWVEVIHVVEPNRHSRIWMPGTGNMAIRSAWFEVNADDETGLLRESGYEEMPVMAPRWDATGEDVYGSSCPGMDALGDCKALQLLERRKAQIVGKTARPPMVAPGALRNTGGGDFDEGGTTYLDSTSSGQKIEPAQVMPPAALSSVAEMIARHEERIQSAFYADLWLMLANNATTMTAREVAERHEEKMLQLGPVLERLQDELLDPLIDRTFAILLRSGMLPDPPEELQGQDLRVEYVSIISQAQKLLGVTALREHVAFVTAFAPTRPDALDKLDVDATIDAHADAIGVPPNVNLSGEKVAAIREGRAAEQQQAQEMQQAAAMVQGAQTLSQTSMEGDTGLNRLLGAYGAAPPAGSA